METLQIALEHHHVVAEICKIDFVNQYVPSFQMSYHKDLAHANKILVKLRRRPKNALLHLRRPTMVWKESLYDDEFNEIKTLLS